MTFVMNLADKECLQAFGITPHMGLKMSFWIHNGVLSMGVDPFRLLIDQVLDDMGNLRINILLLICDSAPR